MNNNDDMIERRKAFVTSEMQKMKSQFANVESIFVHNEIAMLNT